MARPNKLKNPTTICIIIEREQITKLNKLCGNGNVSEYIRELIDQDKGNLKPYLDMLKTQSDLITSLNKTIEAMEKEKLIIESNINPEIKEPIKPKPIQKELIRTFDCPACHQPNIISRRHGERRCIKCNFKFEY